MTDWRSGGPNTYGYAVLGSAALGGAVLAVGGWSLATYAGLFFVVALLFLWRALREGRDEHHRPERERTKGEKEDDRDRREKEVEADVGFGGGLG